MFDPWALLAEKYPRIQVVTARLERVSGLTNGTDVIWLDDRLLQVEQRCTLTHEIVHVELGHTTCQPPASERMVRIQTARLLIDERDLVAASSWARDEHELADELHVTPHVLRDRIHDLRNPATQPVPVVHIV